MEEDDDQNFLGASSSLNFNTPHPHRKTTEQEHTGQCASHVMVAISHPQPQPKINNQHEPNVKEEGTNFPRVCPSFN
jgi:hypothetical protein